VLRTFDNVKTAFDQNNKESEKKREPKNGVQYSGFDDQGLPLYFLRDGKMLVTVHSDDAVRSWDLDLASRTPKVELSLKKNMIERVTLSSDGLYLLGIGKGNSGFVWDLSSGKQMLSTKKKLIHGIFSEGNGLLFGYTDLNSGTVWRLEDGRELFSIPEPKTKRVGYYDWYDTGQARFSRQSSRLLTTTAARNRDAYLWDLKTGRLIAKLTTEDATGGFGDQFEFKLIGDGKLALIAAAQSTGLGWVWNAFTGTLIRRIQGYAGLVKKRGAEKILQLIDGKVIVSTLDGQEEIRFGRGFNINQVADLEIDFETNSAIVGGRSHEGPLELWDIKADALRANLGRISPDGAGPGFVFSPDGSEALSETDDGPAKLWNTRSGALLSTLIPENGGLADEPRFSPDGRSILVDFVPEEEKKGEEEKNGEKVRTLIWRLKGVSTLRLGSPTRSATFSPDGSRILITAEGNSAKIWLTNGKAVVAELKGHTGTIVDAAFSSDGSLVVTGAWDNTAKIWSAKTGALKATLKGHASGVARVAFSGNGKLALTASHDSTGKIWDVQTGGLKATLVGHRGSIIAASFSPDDRRIVTASTDETAAVWDTETGTRLAVLAGHTGALFNARFSPDGVRILTSSEDHTARVWDAATGSSLALLEAHGGMVNDAQWSPDGASILTVSNDKLAILWDASTFNTLMTLKGHLGQVTRGTFSPDGKQAATISEDRTFRLWDVETGALLATHAGHEKTIHSLAFSPDGRIAATTSSDATSRLWVVFPGSLKERIGEVGKMIAKLRPLTKDECAQHDVVAVLGAETVCLGE
jgi:WD40 repeat protein